MSALTINRKRYALLVKATGQIESFVTYPYEGPEPPDTGVLDLSARSDLVDHHVSDTDLGRWSESKFQAQKYAMMVAGVFQAWMAKVAAPNVQVTGLPTNDGSLFGVVKVTDGPANATYHVKVVGRGQVACSPAGGTASLDRWGNDDPGTVKLKFYGDGRRIVQVHGVEFLTGSTTITPEVGF